MCVRRIRSPDPLSTTHISISTKKVRILISLIVVVTKLHFFPKEKQEMRQLKCQAENSILSIGLVYNSHFDLLVKSGNFK